MEINDRNIKLWSTIGPRASVGLGILDLAKNIHELSNIKSHFQENITYIEDRPFNDQRYYIENQKLRNLGWKITKTLEEGLKEFVALFNLNLKNETK